MDSVFGNQNWPRDEKAQHLKPAMCLLEITQELKILTLFATCVL